MSTETKSVNAEEFSMEQLLEMIKAKTEAIPEEEKSTLADNLSKISKSMIFVELTESMRQTKINSATSHVDNLIRIVKFFRENSRNPKNEEYVLNQVKRLSPENLDAEVATIPKSKVGAKAK